MVTSETAEVAPLALCLQRRGRMARPLRRAWKIAIWTSSIGVAAFLAHRLFARRAYTIDVGRVSDEWLAQQRWPPSDPFAV